MSGSEQYRAIIITPRFLSDLISDRFSAADRRRFLQALARLDADDRHPSLRVHPLRGDLEGQWSASASDQLRITFVRLEDGRKLMLTCSRHYKR